VVEQERGDRLARDAQRLCRGQGGGQGGSKPSSIFSRKKEG